SGWVGRLFSLWSWTNFVKRFYRRIFQTYRYMETSKHSTAQNSGEQLTLLPEGSHVSHSVQPDEEKERKMIATSGQKCLESLEKFSRPTLWVRMFMAS